MGIQVPDEPDPAAGITLTYQEFLGAIGRMREVDFPIERDPAEAWADFAGWRINYEHAAYAVAADVHAVPALWSGDRRSPLPRSPPSPSTRAAAQIDQPLGPEPPGVFGGPGQVVAL